MTRAKRASLAVAIIAASTLTLFAETALAESSRFGRNLGEEAKGLLVALFLTVAGLVTLPVLGRRDVNGGLVLGLLVVILGGFVFAQGSVKQVIVDLWRALVG